MATPHAVGLVLDPDMGDAILPLAHEMHIWAVGSPANLLAAENFWKGGSQRAQYNVESGVTTFDYDANAAREAWCSHIISTIDQHHDEMAHDPPYTVLKVYGLRFSAELRVAFVEFGFVDFQDTQYGFLALKHSPKPLPER